MQKFSSGRVNPGLVTFGILLYTIGHTSGANTTGTSLSKVDMHIPDFLQFGLYLN